MTERTILRLSGADARSFLQGLVTNDVDGIDAGLVYAALLTPQGKYIADFFLARDGADILLDLSADLADTVTQRLTLYRLRADVTIARTSLHLHRGLGPCPNDGFDDPRSTTLGWRAYRSTAQTDDTVDWTALRVASVIPESGAELTPDSYILEAGFERLHGVDFRKGCYVGQEVTARMKHKTELRKGLVQVQVTGDAAPGTPVLRDDKPVGMLHSRSGTRAIAYLRYDRATGPLQAGAAQVVWAEADG